MNTLKMVKCLIAAVPLLVLATFASAAELAGTVTMQSESVAIGGGSEWTILENQNGVIMKVKATQAGVKLSLGSEGLKVSMK